MKAPSISIPRGVLKQRKKIAAGTKVTFKLTGISTARKALRGSIVVIAQ
jgi:hypothetical protein